MSDRVYHQLREHLAYLKLGAIAEQLAAALQQAEQDKPSYTRFLHDLLATEVSATEQRRLDGRLRFASFPAHKTLEQFDFTVKDALYLVHVAGLPAARRRGRVDRRARPPARRRARDLAVRRREGERPADRAARSGFTLHLRRYSLIKRSKLTPGTLILRPFRRPLVT